MKKIFKTLTEACATVLKGHANDAALVSKEMTADEFAKHATDEIEKAKADTVEKAIARLSALRTSIAVASSAFVAKELDKFEIPVFDEAAQAEADMAKKVAGLEATVAELKAKLDKTDDDDDDDDAKAAKAKADADDKTGEQTDAEKAKAKVDADKKKEEDEKAAADKKKEEEAAAAKKAADDDDGKGWPMDLAKSFGDNEVKELYDWGPDPKAAPTQH